MAKQGIEKLNSKSHSTAKLNEQKLLQSQTVAESKITKKCIKYKENVFVKTELIKKECVVPDIEHVENYSYFEKDSDNLDKNIDKNHKSKKKFTSKLSKEPDENKIDFLTEFGQLKLSQTVIVNSVLKSSKLDQNIIAILPESLNSIYNRFINSKRYIESLQLKDEYFCGIGLLGVNIEEKIYTKRKSLEDSLKRGIRLRPNPKPTKLFDGTIINRPSRNCTSVKSLKALSSQPTIVLRGKPKYNLFNIGIDTSVKKNKSRRNLRKPIKKKLIQKFASNKESEHPNSVTSEEEPDTNSNSIAFTRPKRQQKIPQLDFKYCYTERTTARNRKYPDSNSDGGKSIEIVDSDSSSVVEVSPPNDVDVSDDSVNEKSVEITERSSRKSSKPVQNNRRGWRPKETKALNLLDKLRLGLQCTVIQTEQDIIIQNLSLDDLGTLQSRLQGLATFKNIEAEYDKNGQETARATIDRKLLNLPLKPIDSSFDLKSGGSGTCSTHGSGQRRYEDSLKRKLLTNQFGKYQTERKKLTLQEKNIDDMKKSHQSLQSNVIATSNSYKGDESSMSWIRPKGRSVKKVRKLYTQSGSTPNILSRSQVGSRSDNLMTSSARTATNQALTATKNQTLSFSQAVSNTNNGSSSNNTINNTTNINSSNSGNNDTNPVSFYSQLSTMASNITTIIAPVAPVLAKPVVSTGELLTSSSLSISVPVAVPCSEPCLNSSVGAIATTSANNSHISVPVTSTDSSVKPGLIVVEKATANPHRTAIDLVSPATAMSASQLLMLKRGGAHTSPEASTVTNAPLVSVVNNNEQLYANQILKPFKKAFITSSPPKLELDDEEVEADFELTPSMITQVKNVSVPINLSNPTNVPTKNNFFSKPLIQSSGILPAARRPISLSNPLLFPPEAISVSNSVQVSSSCCLPVTTKPIVAVDKPGVCVISAQSVSLPNSGGISTAASTIITAVVSISNIPSVSLSHTTNSLSTTNANQTSNVKLKPRKWTHNFHTSDSINFREVLCSTSRISNTIQSSLNTTHQVQLPITNSFNCLANSKPISLQNSSVTPNIISPLRTPDKSNQTPSKNSSAVLKSLLVGTNTSNDICSINKSANWASKYLSSTSSLQDSSKIKWQVGGTVVTSLPSLLTPVSKESSSLEVTHTSTK